MAYIWKYLGLFYKSEKEVVEEDAVLLGDDGQRFDFYALPILASTAGGTIELTNVSGSVPRILLLSRGFEEQFSVFVPYGVSCDPEIDLGSSIGNCRLKNSTCYIRLAYVRRRINYSLPHMTLTEFVSLYKDSPQAAEKLQMPGCLVAGLKADAKIHKLSPELTEKNKWLIANIEEKESLIGW
jgi:hypothetical protein